MGRVRPDWRGMAHTRQKDEDETTAPGAAGASSAHYSSRPPANNGWIKIPVSVGAILASPDQRQHAERAALRRLGYDKTELTIHGLRSTASTLLNESGKWHADAIERQLAHQEANEIRGAYTHAAEFWQERVRMMRWWADDLDRMKELGRVIKMSA
jgi:integrase